MQHPATTPQFDMEPTGTELYHLMDFFKVLGNPARILEDGIYKSCKDWLVFTGFFCKNCRTLR